jgi:transcriptional regulator GlxA family with amidase domain
MTYLRKMGFERMAKLLSTTDLTIAAVARLVGWTDSNHVSRSFHAAYGVSPTESRRPFRYRAASRRPGQIPRSTTPPTDWKIVRSRI